MCKKQLNIHTPHQLGLLFTLLWAKEKGISPHSSREEQAGTSKNDEENSSSREPSLQAPFTHPGMHFPPIPPALATLQTAAPMRPCHVVTLGHFGVSQTTQGPAPNPISLPPAGARLLWKSKTEETFAHHPFGFNKTSQPAIWYQMSKGVCFKKVHMHILVYSHSNMCTSV